MQILRWEVTTTTTMRIAVVICKENIITISVQYFSNPDESARNITLQCVNNWNYLYMDVYSMTFMRKLKSTNHVIKKYKNFHDF